jgi:hypothetical protein
LGSQGYVAFRMKPRTGLVPGDLIENTAAIYFDFNEPIITEPSVLVAEFNTGGVSIEGPAGQFLSVMPNPVQDAITIVAPGMGSLKVTGLDGRVVLQSRQAAATSTLSTGSLACGTYLLLWEPDHGAGIITRFMKIP